MPNVNVGDIVVSIRKDFLAKVGTEYVACNGQTVTSSNYPELYAVGVTTIPNMPGHYIRVAKSN